MIEIPSAAHAESGAEKSVTSPAIALKVVATAGEDMAAVDTEEAMAVVMAEAVEVVVNPATRAEAMGTCRGIVLKVKSGMFTVKPSAGTGL